MWKKREQFTIHHLGTQFSFEKGIQEGKVDFIVPVQLQNIKNMVVHAKDGQINPGESWRIVDVLFTPMTRVTLQIPVLSINWRRKLAGDQRIAWESEAYLPNVA